MSFLCSDQVSSALQTSLLEVCDNALADFPLVFKLQPVDMKVYLIDIN